MRLDSSTKQSTLVPSGALLPWCICSSLSRLFINSNAIEFVSTYSIDDLSARGSSLICLGCLGLDCSTGLFLFKLGLSNFVGGNWVMQKLGHSITCTLDLIETSLGLGKSPVHGPGRTNFSERETF